MADLRDTSPSHVTGAGAAILCGPFSTRLREPANPSSVRSRLWNGLLEFDNRKPKNKALSIILEEMDRDSETHHWRFYETVQGEKAGCLTQRPSVFEAPKFVNTGILDTPLPSGEYDFTIWGRGCESDRASDNIMTKIDQR